MQKFKLTFHGKRIDVDGLVLELNTADGVELANLESSSDPATSLLERDPLHQFELVDVIIAFTINIAAAYTYEEIRSAIRWRAEAKGFKEKTTSPGDTDES